MMNTFITLSFVATFVAGAIAGAWRPGRLMAVLGLVVVWSATCAFGLSATVNTDCGKRVLYALHRIRVDALERMATTECTEINTPHLAQAKKGAWQ